MRHVWVLLLLAPAAAYASDVHDYVGAQACGTCHAPQLQAWREGPHVRSMRSLTDRQKRDPVCLSCHTMVPAEDRPDLAGVQCESCHGPGRTYAPDNVMRDPVLAELLGLAQIDAQTCATCHQGHTPAVKTFEYAAAVLKVCQNRLARAAAPDSPPADGVRQP